MSEAVTVTELTRAIKGTLEENFDTVLVEGEVFSSKLHSSGHFYFSLKDEGAVISCTMWRTQASRLPKVPRDGDQVVVAGRLSVYEPRGAYQLVAHQLKPAGQGDLQARLEELRRKLTAEGLFDADRKRELPAYPFKVAVVTSPTGAVLHDIWHVLSRRAPHLEMILAPSPVQGTEAIGGLVAALDRVAALEGTPDEPDVVIVARGGGSLEDLWAFNEEAVVRAVAACPFPIISAVGHETDTTLCDFAADVRAPTPSAAAELVSEEREVLLAILDDHLNRSGEALLRMVERRRERLEWIARRPCLLRPEEPIERAHQTVDLLSDRLDRAQTRRIELAQARLGSIAGKLDALSPLKVLSRGYAAISTPSGKVVVKSTDLATGDLVKIAFADAARMARIEAS